MYGISLVLPIDWLGSLSQGTMILIPASPMALLMRSVAMQKELA